MFGNYLDGIQKDTVWKTNPEPSVIDVIKKIEWLQGSTSTNNDEDWAISIVLEWLNENKEF